MKSRITLISFGIAGLFACLTATTTQVAASNTTSPGSSKEAPAETPKSVFLVPRNPVEGRDPFFPNSSRVYATFTPTNAPVALSKISLVWHGISGTADAPLVMINGQTFAKGDEASLHTLKGERVRVRCLEIQKDSVVVDIAGERRVLRLAPGR